MSATSSGWKSTACILCECNCGIEVELGGADGRRFVRVRGDDAHPASQGYACEKPARLDFYQNGPHRLTKPLAAAPGRRLRRDRLGDGDPRGGRALRCDSRRARRRVDLLLRRRRAGQPPAGGVLALDARRPRLAVSLERAGAGEDRRVLGGPADAGRLHARRLRALRGGALPRQEPVALPQHPARARDAEGDRERSGALPDRRRPAPHGDRGPRRHPPPGAARCGRLAARRDGRGAGAGRSRGARLAGSAHRGRGARAAALRDAPGVRVLREGGRSRGARAPRHAAPRRGVERRELRGPRGPDEPPLDPRQLPAPPALPAHRELRQAGRRLHSDGAPAARLGRRGAGRPRPQPGHGLARDRRPRALQRDPRRDPHGPSEALPRDARREREPRPLPRRRAPHARSARRPRAAGGGRRRADRDRAPRALRAARRQPVREGRGDGLQLRVPEQLLPPAKAASSSRSTGLFAEAELHARLVEALGALPADAVAALREAWDAGRPAFRARFYELLGRQPGLFPLVPALLFRAIGDKLPQGLAEGAVVWGGLPDRGAAPAGLDAPRRLRGRAAGARRRALRRDPGRPERGDLLRRRLARELRARADAEPQDPARRPRALPGAREPRRRAGSRNERRVSLRALRGRAALLHRQHDHAQPRVAPEGPLGRAPHPPRGRAPPRPRATAAARGSPPSARASRWPSRSRIACSRDTCRCPTGWGSTTPTPARRGSRPTSSPRARTATGSRARPGTSTPRRASRRSSHQRPAKQGAPRRGLVLALLAASGAARAATLVTFSAGSAAAREPPSAPPPSAGARRRARSAVAGARRSGRARRAPARSRRARRPRRGRRG